MQIDQRLRQGVIQSLPEAARIQDRELRERVYDAWAISLATSGFQRIEDMPCSGNPGWPEAKSGTQADHLRGVARLALAMAKDLKEHYPDMEVDLDEVIAAGLCHDLGKPFEYDPANQARWQADPRKSGLPAVRHPVYGVHVALLAGLPESIVHVAGAHSAEGERVKRSLLAEIVHHADEAFWQILGKAGIMGEG